MRYTDLIVRIMSKAKSRVPCSRLWTTEYVLGEQAISEMKKDRAMMASKKLIMQMFAIVWVKSTICVARALIDDRMWSEVEVFEGRAGAMLSSRR